MQEKLLDRLTQNKLKWDIWEMGCDNETLSDINHWRDQWMSWKMVGGDTRNGRLYFIECLAKDLRGEYE